MCERAGFQQETSLILYEVIYLCSAHLLAHSSVSFSLVLTLHSLLHTLTFSCSSIWHTSSLVYTVTLSYAASLSLSHTYPSVVLHIYISLTRYSCTYSASRFDYISHDALCVTGSKAQSNRADTGLWRLSGQGPGWAHGRGHHCLPEVRLILCVCVKFGLCSVS